MIHPWEKSLKMQYSIKNLFTKGWKDLLFLSSRQSATISMETLHGKSLSQPYSWLLRSTLSIYIPFYANQNISEVTKVDGCLSVSRSEKNPFSQNRENSLAKTKNFWSWAEKSFAQLQPPELTDGEGGHRRLFMDSPPCPTLGASECCHHTVRSLQSEP